MKRARSKEKFSSAQRAWYNKGCAVVFALQVEMGRVQFKVVARDDLYGFIESKQEIIDPVPDLGWNGGERKLWRL